MKSKTKQILEVLKVLSWIIFIGLCIKTGAILISFIVTLLNPEAGGQFYTGEDLSSIYDSGLWKYIAVTSFIIALPALKAYMFFLVIRLLSGINLQQPFSQKVGDLLERISWVALGIGSTGVIANGYIQWLHKSGDQFIYESNSTEFFFLAGIIFIVAQIFKRGLEIQDENELTV